MTNKDLRIAVRREYFEQIASGEKKKEYRYVKENWCKRLIVNGKIFNQYNITRRSPELYPARHYDTVTITLGYPKAEDKDRHMTFKYKGFILEKIAHKEFGYQLVWVFAIDLSERIS